VLRPVFLTKPAVRGRETHAQQKSGQIRDRRKARPGGRDTGGRVRLKPDTYRRSECRDGERSRGSSSLAFYARSDSRSNYYRIVSAPPASPIEPIRRPARPPRRRPDAGRSDRSLCSITGWERCPRPEEGDRRAAAGRAVPDRLRGDVRPPIAVGWRRFLAMCVRRYIQTDFLFDAGGARSLPST